MKWGVITFAGGKFHLVAIKERVHVGFSIKGLNEGGMSPFEGNSKTMRHIKNQTLNDIDEKKLLKLIRLVNKKCLCTTY